MKTVKHFASNIVLALLVAPLSFGQHYDQTTLVANTSGVASAIDPQLVNAWGLSRGSGSDWWISDAGTGVSTLYDGAGDKQSLVVTIPPADPNDTQAPLGTPSGTIFNGSQADFLLAPGRPAIFLFSTLDGTIAGGTPTSPLRKALRRPRPTPSPWLRPPTDQPKLASLPLLSTESVTSMRQTSPRGAWMFSTTHSKA